MREIIFRGKNKLSGGWCEGYLVKTGDHFRISTQNDMISFGVDPETVGQYTGLKDKNSKRIFEGDILRGYNFLHKNRTVYQVIFENGCFYYCDEGGVTWLNSHIENVEVIGNIHDNPELLEVK